MWGPPVKSWFISPSNYSYLRTINHSEIGVMFTNLAIDRGPHIVALGSRSKPLWDTIRNSSLRRPESTLCAWPKWLTVIWINKWGNKWPAWDTIGYTWMRRMTPSAVGSFPILRYTNGAFAKRIQQQELHCDALNTRDLKSRNITPSFNPAKETIFKIS